MMDFWDVLVGRGGGDCLEVVRVEWWRFESIS